MGPRQAKALVGGRLQGFGPGWRPLWASYIPRAPALLPPQWPPQPTCNFPVLPRSGSGDRKQPFLLKHHSFWLHWQNRLVRSFASGLEGRQLEHHWSQASPGWRQPSEIRGPGRAFHLEKSRLREVSPAAGQAMRPLVSRSFSPRPYPNTLTLSSNLNMNQCNQCNLNINQCNHDLNQYQIYLIFLLSLFQISCLRK